MLNSFRRLLDLNRSLGPATFTLVFVVGMVLEGILRRWMWAAQQVTKLALVACVLTLFTLMAIVTAKRLLDVRWPRWLACLVIGPTLLDILSGIHRTASMYLKPAAALCTLLFLGYLALAVFLVLKKHRPTTSHIPLSARR